MFEHKSSRLISQRAFLRRVARHVLFSVLIVAVALAVGTVGYHLFGLLSWTDSFYNASMILGGMGPATPINTDAGKYFASFYALFSGLVFIGLVAVMLGPFIHRMLHSFHWNEG